MEASALPLQQLNQPFHKKRTSLKQHSFVQALTTNKRL
jgi:hypothetical protein